MKTETLWSQADLGKSCHLSAPWFSPLQSAHGFANIESQEE